ncbi:enoyl-CoA hydratase [Thalassovita sp.]|jgi:enoyl-CoA hydratase|uniref:enoyl-CoA hydratase n=1 Tax=Thalassovita sp. TaxID=1979401 RepID=UPI003B58D381
MPPFETILYDSNDGITIITLNRPEALNALSRQMRSELAKAIRLAQSESRVIILTAAGDRAFCVGMDMKEGPAEAGAPAPASPMQALAECPCPVIAAINGYAITGGLELALGCDLILASETASFADTHAKIGALPGWGLTQRLSRIIGLARAKQMHFSCKRIDAKTALDWGLVASVVPPAGLLNAALQMARDFAEHDPAIMREMKRVVDQGYAVSLPEGLEIESTAAHAWNRRDRSADS